jgi:hypothetical protein
MKHIKKLLKLKTIKKQSYNLSYQTRYKKLYKLLKVIYNNSIKKIFIQSNYFYFFNTIDLLNNLVITFIPNTLINFSFLIYKNLSYLFLHNLNNQLFNILDLNTKKKLILKNKNVKKKIKINKLTNLLTETILI